MRSSLRFLAGMLALAFLGATPAATLSQAFDGPYILSRGEGWEAWTVATTDAGLARHVKPVAIGGTITIQAVGSLPAFTVKLREPAEPGPDEAPLPKNTPAFLMADSHGEFEITVELLMKQGVIDKNLNWNFGKGHLVVLGDIFDRGPRQTEILWLLYQLEAEAQAAGGALHMNLGNHEAMVLTGDVRYLHERYTQAAQALGVSSYSELWSRDSLLGQWLRSKATVFRFGRTLCLHGGISQKTVADRWTLPEINNTVRAWLNSDKDLDAARAKYISGSNGPLWYRGHVQQKDSAEEIEAVKAFYDVDRLAVGHTTVQTVRALYGGSVIAVHVYPTRDASGMNMEGAYIDAQGFWYRATISGTREILHDEAGKPLHVSLQEILFRNCVDHKQAPIHGHRDSRTAPMP